MLLVPDPARGADGQGGLVDLTRGIGAFLSFRATGPVGPQDGIIGNLTPVRMTNLLARCVGCGCFLDSLCLGLSNLLVQRASLSNLLVQRASLDCFLDWSCFAKVESTY